VSPPPALHDLVATVCAPTSVFSGADGQIRAAGVQGMLHADVRVLSEAVLRLDGHEPEPVGHAPAGPGGTVFVSVAHPPGGPAIRIERTRRVVPGGLTEQVVLTSDAAPIAATVTLDLAADFAPIATVRSGGIPAPPGTWRHSGIAVTVTGDRSRAVRIAPGEPVVLRWEVRVEDAGAVVHAPAGPVEWSRPVVRADDHRLARLVDRALDDLAGLRLGDGGADTYLGAGVPWYLTLFGRDSLWAARMLLPLGTGLAAGTLRVLARRQGARVDPVTGEAPGKILHELRRDEFMLAGSGLRLPAAYYGTVDATLLWISLLHDTWRWGHPAAEVAALLPALEAALGWLSDHADPDGDGFLEYVDTSGHGLANQGWKDSGDAVRFRDGRIAEPPIALAEVQGYAHRAALDGAALLDAFGRPGGERWRAYADGLAGRFRAAFWVDGGYPALALDRDKRPVDSLTSNIGHLLGTGLLSDAEERAVADALADPSMSGGFGLRTMSAADRGFDPLSYHCGSVWAHDTAIVVAGLARAGFGDAAATLIDGLLAAGAAFDFRLPELHAGFARDGAAPPTAYPSACRPQAWSAAAAVLIVQAVLGLEPDVPAGTVRLRPPAGAPLGAIEVRGLRIGGESVDVAVDPAGRATITGPATGG
jgi:glycogen debranching enzyme